MKFKAPTVSSSIGIEIKPPSEYSMHGETMFIPKFREGGFGGEGTIAFSEAELLIGELYSYLDRLKKHEAEVVRMIESIKARVVK